MKLRACTAGLVMAVLTFGAGIETVAQATPGANVRLPVSAFAQVGDTYTGLSGATNFLGGRNISLTVGVDISVLSTQRFLLDTEVRGTYPLYRGHVDGQKSLLAGFRLGHAFRRSALSHLLVYGNALAGRGEQQYVDGGFPAAMLLYTSSTSAVYGAGFGFEIAVGNHLSYKGEAGVQHWNVPVTTRGVIYAKEGSGGIVYRFPGRRVR